MPPMPACSQTVVEFDPKPHFIGTLWVDLENRIHSTSSSLAIDSSKPCAWYGDAFHPSAYTDLGESPPFIPETCPELYSPMEFASFRFNLHQLDCLHTGPYLPGSGLDRHN